MKSYQTSIEIKASADDVWAILVDAGRWSEWNPDIHRVEGAVERGGRIKIVSEPNPKRAFPVKVTELVSPTTMVFSGGMPLGLFKGVRTFTLAPDGDTTRFTMREQYTGPLLALIWRSMPDLQPTFDRFADSLKTRVESGAEPG